MKSIKVKNQNGIVLLPVLLTLTLLGIVGLTFVFYASERACSQNPTIETRDGTCVKTIEPDRR